MSEIKQDKFYAVASAIREFFDYQSGAPMMLEASIRKDAFREDMKLYLRRMKTREAGYVEGRKGVEGENILVRKVSEGLRITTGLKTLFDEGSAHLNIEYPEVRKALDATAKELRGYSNRIAIVGFASMDEKAAIVEPGINPKDDDALRRLAVARAMSVWHYLVYDTDERLKIPDRRIDVTGRVYRYTTGADMADSGVSARSVEITITQDSVPAEGQKYNPGG